MYWLPAIFIFVEILYIYHVSDLISYVNATILYKKYKDENLESYIKNKYKDSIVTYFIIGGLIALEVIYFIIGLFFPFWILSIIFICYFIILILMTKFERVSTAKMIKLANLKNFSTSNIKFDRLLKLNEIKKSDIKIHNLKTYSYPIFKIIFFITIIVTHYNPINPVRSGNRIGFYTDTTMLVNKEGKSLGKYAYTVNVVELDKYTNGMSKIKLLNIEVTYGVDPNNYDWIKECETNKFSSLRKESDVVWLESKNNRTK